MVFKSMFKSVRRFFHKGWLHTESRGSKKNSLRSRLFVEVLESRELLSASPPFVVSVTPADGAKLTIGNPTITIHYDETMIGNQGAQTGAADPKNYLLV